MPCERNGQSFDKARRRWDLADDSRLLFADLLEFDRAMLHAERALLWLTATAPRGLGSQVRWCEARQFLWFARAEALFVFNFHPEQQLDADIASCGLCAPLQLALSSDLVAYGGLGRAAMATHAPITAATCGGSCPPTDTEILLHVVVPPSTGCVFCRPQALN